MIAAPIAVFGLVSTAMPLAGKASAFCDSADCVPNVASNVVEGAPCAPGPSFVFGLDPGGGTLICAASGMWVRVGRLIGTRELALQCDAPGESAQEPLAGNDFQPRTPGVPLKCAEIDGAPQWVHF